MALWKVLKGSIVGSVLLERINQKLVFNELYNANPGFF